MDHQERNHPLDHQDTKEPAVPHPAAQKGPHIAQPRARLASTSLLQKKPKPNPKLSLPARSTPPPLRDEWCPPPTARGQAFGEVVLFVLFGWCPWAEGTLVGGGLEVGGGLMA